MGCCYSCYIYSKHLLRLNGRYPSNDVARLLQNQPGTVTMAFVCLVMGLGIFGLFLFNVYLVSRGYGTIDQAKAWLDPSEKQGSEKARSKRGFQSLAGNWKNVFDLQDARLWWILWIVPTTRPKKGRGYERALSSL